jgi:outer membrane immunogenic protein
MKKILLASIAVVAFCAAPAFAADMPVKAPVYKAPAPVFSWTGWYAGVDGGYGWGHDGDITFTAPVTGFVGTSQGFKSSGGFGGGQIGFNQQTGQWVWGVETDIQGSDIRDKFNVTVPSNGGPLGVDAEQRLNYFGTVRGRLGVASDRTFIYATGGFAYGEVKDRALLTNGGATALLMKDSTRAGFVVGGGVEYNFAPSWSVKLEYQYIDLGGETISGVSTNGVFLTSSNIDNKFQTVRIGLNYKFGGDPWGKSPVVAKY